MTTQIKRAHGRVARALSLNRGVLTPHGLVFDRPSTCQSCGAEPKMASHRLGKTSNIIAHHIDGYGTKIVDTTVVFLCRSCHGRAHA